MIVVTGNLFSNVFGALSTMHPFKLPFSFRGQSIRPYFYSTMDNQGIHGLTDVFKGMPCIEAFLKHSIVHNFLAEFLLSRAQWIMYIVVKIPLAL